MDANGPIPKWIQIVDAKVGKHTLVFFVSATQKEKHILKVFESFLLDTW